MPFVGKREHLEIIILSKLGHLRIYRKKYISLSLSPFVGPRFYTKKQSRVYVQV